MIDDDFHIAMFSHVVATKELHDKAYVHVDMDEAGKEHCWLSPINLCLGGPLQVQIFDVAWQSEDCIWVGGQRGL